MVRSTQLQKLTRRSNVDFSGLTHVTATVQSMAEPERSWTGRFRVDAVAGTVLISTKRPNY